MPSVKNLNLGIKVNGSKEAEDTFKSVTRQMYKLRREVSGTTEDTDEWKKANQELAKVEQKRSGMITKQKAFREEVKNTTDATNDNTQAMQEFGDSTSKTFSSLMSGDLVGVQEGLRGMKAGIMGATKAAWAFIATPLGIALAAIVTIGVAAKAWFSYNEAALEANRTTQQLTQLSGDALDQARVRAKALEKTFGTEFKENLEIARNLVKAFDISYEEAFDTIENGMIRGGKANDDFMKTLKEYPKLFAQAGFSVEGFQRIVNTGIDMGVYDDKLPDAIKEFSLSVMEQTASSRDSLENAFGKSFTDKLFKGINDGSVTVKDSLLLVAEEAEHIGLNAQTAQQLTADLFRGAGEDAGGALLIFDAVTKSLTGEARALTPLEEGLKRVADANRELEEAQNNALKSDQYAAFANNIAVGWTQFKTGFFTGMNAVLEGLASVDTKFRKFVFQSAQYVKDAFTIGADADWDKLGKQFDKKQKEMEVRAKALQENEQKKSGSGTDPDNTGANEDTTAADAKRLADQKSRESAAAAEKKKRLDALDALEAEYIKKSEDRDANSALKKAILEKERAVKKAEELGASKQMMDEINAAHDIKIQEEKTAEEEVELERLRAFDEKKRTLENELELAKATSDEEKAAIKAEQDLEKEELAYEKKIEDFQLEMERLQLNEEEKNAVLESLKEAHENVILGIQKAATDEKIADEKRLQAAKRQLWNDSLDAAIGVAGAETRVGQALLIAKQMMAARETAMQLGLFANKMALNVGEATGAAATGAAETAKVGFPQNIPLLIGFAAQMIGIISAVKGAAKAKSQVKTPTFFYGGATGSKGMGFTDDSGRQPVGYVHANEYVIPEVVRNDPEMPQIEAYIEQKRRKKLGLFSNGGETSGTNSGQNSSSQASGSDTNSLLISVIGQFMSKLDQPLVVDNYFGFEAEEKRQKTQRTLEKLKQKTQIKS